MEINFKEKMLDSIGRVYEMAENSKLESSLFELLDEDLTFLSAYLRTTKSQSFLIALVFSLNYKGDTVDINDLNEYLDCNPIKLLNYSDDIHYLFENGYLKRKMLPYRVGLSLSNEQMIINAAISDAILKSEELPKLVKYNFNSPIELIEEINKKIKHYKSIEDYGVMLSENVTNLIEANEQNNYSSFILENSITVEDTCVLSSVIWETMLGSRLVNLKNILECIYGENAQMLNKMQLFLNKKDALTKNGLCEVVEDTFFNDVDIKLTDSAKKKFGEMGIKLQISSKNSRNIISCNNIVKKQLFYNKEEQKQINTLHKILIEKNLKKTRKRLQEKKLPKGIVTLFYGPPGTGKTESVLQLAKVSGREVFKVDISATKSMWFGESEKLIKKVFTDYTDLCENSKKLPILLFNEADAIISSRREGKGSAVDQTLNTIQNIILEELENFDGILIATTNLEGNMDSAFERRFLFKVKMDNPTPEVKAKIWLEKMEGLTQAQAIQLSQMFDFSGGQIDNIVRKKEIEEIVHGKTISFEEILSFCGQENLSKSNISKVGFSI